MDPVRDIEIIHEELRLKDEEMIGPIMEKLEKVAVRGSDKKLKPEYVSQCPSMSNAAPTQHVSTNNNPAFHTHTVSMRKK